MAVLLCFAAWQVELVLVFFGLAREPFSRPFVSAWLWQRTARRIRHETRRKVAVQIWRGKPTVNLQFWRVYSVSILFLLVYTTHLVMLGMGYCGLYHDLPWFTTFAPFFLIQSCQTPNVTAELAGNFALIFLAMEKLGANLHRFRQRTIEANSNWWFQVRKRGRDCDRKGTKGVSVQ